MHARLGNQGSGILGTIVPKYLSSYCRFHMLLDAPPASMKEKGGRELESGEESCVRI